MSIEVQDCVEGMNSLSAKTFNLIIADPPYNLSKDFGVWKESEHEAEWKPWSRRWLKAALRVLTNKGNIFVYGIAQNQCWIQCLMYDLGYQYRRQIIWHYENNFGYVKGSLTRQYESLLWFSKTKEYVFSEIREPYKSTSRLKYPVTKKGKSWLPHPEGRLAGDVWSFPVLAGKRFKDERVDHPTQKPLSISRRIVKHFSELGDTVLVPFVGSGTECIAAILENRKYQGFEINPKYVTLAQKRIKAAEISKTLDSFF